jgi:pre-mRNA-splicing factor ISY1
MARNEEKAMNLFNKWQTFKHEFHAVNANRRPLFATECESLVDAEKFRREIVRDLTKKIAMIQNATLGEFKIRDLNDEINKMMKQKHYWEIRIRELGGSDLKRSRRLFDLEGKELPGQPGYRYYGAAKDLPGVRELFAEEAADIELRKKKR